MEKIYHPYHLVNPSPWPFCMSLGVLCLTLNTVAYFHMGLLIPLLMSFIMMLMFMVMWFKDMNVESNVEGFHTYVVMTGLKLGFMLFMVSEVLFFVSFFWAFFHSSLSPAVEMGMNWPPTGINALDPFSVPLLNTAILLSSGATVTWAHHSMVKGDKKEAFLGLSLTMFLGFMFTGLQALEYIEAPFNMADSVYGSTFFVATGFHGIHVMIGTMFLSVCLFKLMNSHFTNSHHMTFEVASWYWHFVDVVWLFLYMCIYWWGS